jgi:hypothetical protein
MKPPPGYERKLASIASRQDRFLVGREHWDERDWRAQHQHEAEQRSRRADLLASLDRPLVVPPVRVCGGGLLPVRPDEG